MPAVAITNFPLGFSEDSDLLRSFLLEAGISKDHFIWLKGERHLNIADTLLRAEQFTNIEGDLKISDLYYQSTLIATTSIKSGPSSTQKHSIMHVKTNVFPDLLASLTQRPEILPIHTAATSDLTYAEIFRPLRELKVTLEQTLKRYSEEAADEKLHGALTKEELTQLPCKELLTLNEADLQRLVENIQEGRPGPDDSSTNHFLSGLIKLLSYGIPLAQLAYLDTIDQIGFMSLAWYVKLFMDNGINFDRLASLKECGLSIIPDCLGHDKIRVLHEQKHDELYYPVLFELDDMVNRETVSVRQRSSLR